MAMREKEEYHGKNGREGLGVANHLKKKEERRKIKKNGHL